MGASQSYELGNYASIVLMGAGQFCKLGNYAS